MEIQRPAGPVRLTSAEVVKPPVRPVRASAFSVQATPADDAGPRVGEMLAEAVRSLEQRQRFVDRVIRQALAGRDFSQSELLAIQAGVYRYTQELELFSRMVEKTVSGLKQTLQSQP